MKRLTRKVVLVPPKRLAVMIWANAAVAISGRPAMKFYVDYPKLVDKEGKETDKLSSSFATSLARGGPRPMLFNADGSDGPALRIEREVPGTLKWLVHPMWDVLEDPERHDVESIHRLMVLLEPAVFELLFDERGQFLRRRQLTAEDLRRLREIGSLDALAALLYLGVEADRRHERRAGIMVYRCARQHLATWACLAWMTLSNQRRLRRVYMSRLVLTRAFEVSREGEQTYFAATALGDLMPDQVNIEPERQVAVVDMLVAQFNARGV